MTNKPETAKGPCPICGKGKPIEYHRTCANTVTCDACGFKVTQSAVGMGDAQERWNRLAKDKARIAKLETALRAAREWLSGWASARFHLSIIDAALDPAPQAEHCDTCKGMGYVDDGEISHYDNGTPYENGPVKCVKDCPDCKAEQGKG